MLKLLDTTNHECPIDKPAFDKFWQGGSIMYPEGVVLYNLVRAYQPSHVLEAGAFIGTSTKFIIEGLKAGPGGRVISVDRQATWSQFMLDRHGLQRSCRLTREDRRLVTLVTAVAQDFMAAMDPETIDFIFEDTSHTRRDTREIATQAIRLLVPGGILVSHDGLMETVREGYSEAGIHDSETLPCGLRIWRKP